MKSLITLLLVLSLTGCKNESRDHPIFKYYPPTDVFEDGYVNKYYTHFYPDNPDAVTPTSISYSVYEKTGPESYRARFFNAGFDLSGESHYSASGSSLHLDTTYSIWRWDTTSVAIRKNIMWDALSTENVVCEQEFESGGKSYLDVDEQTAIRDTIISGIPGKIFSFRSFRKELATDSVISEHTEENYYLEGMGYFGGKAKYDGWSRYTEVVEQMPLSRFEELANHDRKRIAYIDPDETMDKNEGFELCGHERFIYDYYNSTPDGRYLHNKRAMTDTIYSNLDKAKLFDQSGYLIFRFVVNCEGQSGRFIAEGYDHDYQPMEFQEATIRHLYSIIRKLKEWRPVVLDEGPNDAYFYITFKMKNGEITDILP